MRQRRWLKFFKDYNFELMSYHPGKGNVVADAGKGLTFPT